MTLKIDANRMIKLADYPQLRLLAWHMPRAAEILPRDALNLYERNWRHIDKGSLTEDERMLINRLNLQFGDGRVLV